MSGKFIRGEYKERFREIFSVEPRLVTPPRIHNLAYYPARRPCAGARVCTLAAILSADTPLGEFNNAIGFSKLVELAKLAKSGRVKDATILYNVDPDRELVSKLVEKSVGKRLEEVVVVDPMAGGGSIPLEALRLGFRVVAADFNPVAYIILKATIEYPAKYGTDLYKAVVQEARKMIEYAREVLGKYYPQDAQGIILARGVRHSCGGIHPIIKSPLVSARDRIYVNFESDNGKLKISLVRTTPRYSPSLCVHCKTPLNEKAALTKWVKEHVQVIDSLLRGDESVVDKVSELYIPVVIETSTGYRAANDSDTTLLVEAARDLARAAREDPLIYQVLPDTEIPSGNEVFKPLRAAGLVRWTHMYDPRQLLALYHLTKYVQERCRELCEKHGEFGVAVATYLALALTKLINYNNVAVEWHSREVVRDVVGSQYALGREVRLGYDFCEAIPHLRNLPWAFEIDVAESGKLYLTAGGILPVLRFLCERLCGLGDRVSVVLADAAELGRWLSELGFTKVDLIHVDPPYYDQHRYSDIMEFFWVVLRRALLPAIEMGYLFNEKEQKLSDWTPYMDEVPRKREFYGKPGQTGSRFERGMNMFFSEAYKVLDDNGRLVIWFTHSSIQAWEDLFTWLYRNGFEIVKTWQIWSESPQRRHALYKSAFFTSMVIVARKVRERKVVTGTDHPEFIKAIEDAVRQSIDTTWNLYGGLSREVVIMAIADGQAAATRFRLAGVSDEELAFRNRLLLAATRVSVSATLRIIAEKLGLGQVYGEYIAHADSDSLLYLFALLVASPELRVPYDFFEKVRKELRAQGTLLVRPRSGSSELEVPVGQDLLSYVRDVMRYTATRATRLILKASSEVPKVGVEAFVRSVLEKEYIPKADVAYALYMVRICPYRQHVASKLGVSSSNRELIEKTLIRILEQV